jgi:hypothetical protein
MRELGGLGFAQIGAVFESSAAVARQTVYEARLSLRQMETGREMSCEAVQRKLSDSDGRVTRGREIRSHLRNCPDCRAFRDGIAKRRTDLASIAPLPAIASAALLKGVFGGSASGALGGAAAGAGGGAAAGGGSGLAGLIGSGAGGVAASSAVAKAVATFAVVAVAGVSAADRFELINVPVPGERTTPADSRPGVQDILPPGGVPGSPAAGDGRFSDGLPGPGRADGRAGRRGGGNGAGRGESGRRSRDRSSLPTPRRRANRGLRAGAGKANRQKGRPEGLPAASDRGQGTAAAKKSPRAGAIPGPSPERASGGGAGRSQQPAQRPSAPSIDSTTPSPPPPPPAKKAPAAGKGEPAADGSGGSASDSAES